MNTPTPTPSKAYSYIRFSSKEQEQGDSLRRQTAYSAQVAEKLGLELDDSLRMTDKGLSAYHGDHRTKGALGDFLKLVEAGKIPDGSVLIVEALDRLSREGILEATNLLTSILLRGVKIYTAIDDHLFEKDSFNLADFIISATKLAQGHEESLKKSVRLKAAWDAKRDNLDKKKLTGKAPAWLKISRDKTHFEEIPERVEVIQRIFKMKLDGIGNERIARTLNEAGVKTFNTPKQKKKVQAGPGWRKSYIDKILRNRAVIGEFQPHTKVAGRRQPIGEPIKDYFPAVVGEQEFNAVQRRVDINKGRAGRVGFVSNLFRDIARCGLCKGPMSYLNKGEEKYLTCDTHHRRAGCEQVTVRYESFESLMLRLFERHLKLDQVLPADGEMRELREQRDALAHQVDIIEQEKNNLSEGLKWATNKQMFAEIESQMTSLFNKKGALEQQVAALCAEINRRSASAPDLEALRAKIKDHTEPEIRAQIRNHMTSLIDHIDFYPSLTETKELEYVRKEYPEVGQGSGIQIQVHFHTGVVHGLHASKDFGEIERWAYFGEGTLPRLFLPINNSL